MERLGPYRLLSVIGRGSHGQVFKAEGPQGLVALKVLLSDDHPDLRQRFWNEIEALKRIDHPHVVKIYQPHAARHDRLLWYPMDYLGNLTLADYLKRNLPLDEKLRIFYELLWAVEAVHQQGIIHRDIKPKNVMMVRDCPILFDLGLAYAKDNPEPTNAKVGTLKYISPEQLRGENVDEGSDIWSLGVILYRWLTGHLPFYAKDRRELMNLILDPHYLPPPPHQLNPEIDEYLSKQVCMAALQRDRSRRLPTVHRFRTALGGWRGANAIEYLKESVAWEAQGEFLKAITSHEKSHLWSTAIGGAKRLVRLWEMHLRSTPLQLTLARQWPEIKKEIMAQGQVVALCHDRYISTDKLSSQKRYRVYKTLPLPAGIAWEQGVLRCSCDGSEMVVVPEGLFVMGARDEDEWAWSAEKPAHAVFLDAYLIDKYPVTWQQYLRFCEQTGHALPQDPPTGRHPHHPVVNVSWEDAQAYARWSGKTLPSEAQWEKAARGTDERRFPWGNTPPTPKQANYWDSGLRQTTPVDQYPAGMTPYGCYDMVGNVWEWCLDSWQADFYELDASRRPNPLCHDELEVQQVIRGGAWDQDAWSLHVSYRYRRPADYRAKNLGFRCAVNLVVPQPTDE